MRQHLSLGSLGMLVAASLGCATQPIVAPLRYQDPPSAPEQALRAMPPDSSPVVPAVALSWRPTTLANGVRVLHLERHDLPIVSASLVITRGAADAHAPDDLFGLLGLLMTKGTASRTLAELSAAYASLGSTHGVSFGEDGCTLSAKVGSAGLDTAIALLAEQAIRPRLYSRDFEETRGQWSQDFANTRWDAGMSLQRNAAVLLFGTTHAYGFAAPSAAHLSGLQLEDLAALHARVFQPAHAALVVVGDASPDAVDASAARWLGGWSARPEPLARAEVPPPVSAQRVVLIERRDRTQVDGMLFVRTPGFADEDLPAVEVLTKSLGAISSPLREAVRFESGAAYSFGARMTTLRAASYATIGGAFEASKAGEALRTIVAAIRAVRTRGVAAADLERAQATLLAEFRARVATNDGIVSMASSTLLADLWPEALTGHLARIRAVTPADIRRVATRYFADEALHVVVYGDARITGDLAGLGLGLVERRNGTAEHVGW